MRVRVRLSTAVFFLTAVSNDNPIPNKDVDNLLNIPFFREKNKDVYVLGAMHGCTKLLSNCFGITFCCKKINNQSMNKNENELFESILNFD